MASIKELTQQQLGFLGKIVKEDSLDKFVPEGTIYSSKSGRCQKKNCHDDLALAAGSIRKGDLLHLS